MLHEWEGHPVEALRAAWDVPRLEAFSSLDSTNERLRGAAQAGAPAGTVILADWQQAGRGRRGRSWIARPRESLLASILLRAAPGRTITSALPLRVGLTAARVCRRLYDAPVDVKWPNDLVAHGRKLGGILCEATSGPDAAFVVVGIGINVLGTQEAMPPEIGAGAIPLAALATREVDRAELAAALLPAIARLDCELPLSDSEMSELERRDALRGRMLLVDDRRAGTAAGFRADGALRIRAEHGEEVLTHGTVRIAPPTPRP